ncbi:MAG: 30S ribosomal protein S12 methylthiotransferase RimO [Dehalococcoidia bacterium]|nr:30S ribosomal protein S12 methylthiotransferase RimO [Dehalococcoidia bacterium]
MRYCLVTLGCPKNEVDSDGMATLFGQAGYKPVDKPAKADILVVNTCGFIDLAVKESTQALRSLAAQKRPGQILIAAGCLVERYADKLRADLPQIDAVVGTRELERIVEVIEAAKGNGVLHLKEGKRGKGTWDQVSAARGSEARASAYLKIADGCSASCAFCTIPGIKGPYHSKPVADVVDEARGLVAAGTREIILIAQDSTAYGFDRGEREALADLIPAIVAVFPGRTGLTWLRIMYAYPTHVTDRLIEVMARYPQVCHYLDLPLQHADPAVLKRMKRPGDVESVRSLIRRLREAMPDIALRTTFIVGFPGETEEEFQTLLDFMEEISFDRLGVFTYSREPGTVAAALPGQLSDDVKQQRYDRTMAMQQRISLARNRAQVGRELDVLVEGITKVKGKPDSSLFPVVGRTYRDAPEVDGLIFCRGQARPGDIVRVKVIEALEYDLLASIEEKKASARPGRHDNPASVSPCLDRQVQNYLAAAETKGK